MKSWLLAIGIAALVWPQIARAGWDPLQKAERAAARGARLLAAGDSLAAVDAYLEAQALAPDNPRIRMGLGEALYGHGEFKSALAQYRSVAREGRAAPLARELDALYNAGNSAFELGDYQGALEHYTQALVSGGTEPDLLHNLELAQKLLESAQSQEDGESQEGEQNQDGESQQGEQQQQGKDGEQQPGQEQTQQPDADSESENASEEPASKPEDSKPEQPPTAGADSLANDADRAPAASDSLLGSAGMSVAEAMRLLDALDHDEAELRKSILRRLRGGQSEKAGDW